MSALEVNNTIEKSILITLLDDKFYPQLLKISEELRSLGFITELYPEVSKLKKQFQYVDRRGYQRVLIFGEREYESKNYTIKNMFSGEQESLSDLTSL